MPKTGLLEILMGTLRVTLLCSFVADESGSCSKGKELGNPKALATFLVGAGPVSSNPNEGGP